MEGEPGLFENSRETNINSTIAMVEDVLLELGHFINECRDDPPSEGLHSWRVIKGSAMVQIALVEREDDVHLRTVSVVMTLQPQVERGKLFERLLTVNATEIYGAAFAVSERHVLLVSERSTLDLDRSEVYDQIRRVQDYADYYDEKLVGEFGGALGIGQ